MKLCNPECIPICDFCIHAVHEEWEKNGELYRGGPIGCSLHKDEEHQEIAEYDGYCDDFHCFLCDKPND